MGKVDAQDLGSKPTVTLREAMRLSAERDAVAREYVTDFAVTFELTVPALEAALGAGLGWLEAAAETFLTLLAQRPDTLIARKLGPEAAARVTEQAHAAWTAGGVRTPEGREALLEFDASLRDAQNSRNPGTTADLTAAALFVVLLDRGGL
jgi:triphosphoribosyl-dephospho-CoA synthase